MAPQRRAISFHRQLVLFLLAAAVVATRSAFAPSTADTGSPAPAPGSSSSFLRACCATTLHPPLCYDSLLPHAAEFQTSRVRLAGVAANVAAAHLRALLANVKELLLHHAPRTGTRGPSEADALHDCASTVSAAANLARQSSEELAGLEDDAAEDSTTTTGSSRKVRWGVSNAKTWLSAAITNEGTCANGIEEAGAVESPHGKEVSAGVAKVRQHTSIALALVNGIPL